MTHMTGPQARARGAAAGAALTALPRKAEGARPPGAIEKAEAEATNAARRATALVEYMVAAVEPAEHSSRVLLLVLVLRLSVQMLTEKRYGKPPYNLCSSTQISQSSLSGGRGPKIATQNWWQT